MRSPQSILISCTRVRYHWVPCVSYVPRGRIPAALCCRPAPARMVRCNPHVLKKKRLQARHYCRSDGSWKMKIHDKPAIDSDIMCQGTLPLSPMCKLRTTLPHTTGALQPPCCRSDGAVQLATAQTEMTPRATSRARTRESLHMTILQPQSIPVRAKKTPIAVTHTPQSKNARTPNLNVDADGA